MLISVAFVLTFGIARASDDALPGALESARSLDDPRSQTLRLGRSEDGRPISAVRVGDSRGRRVLVIGCIHGTECAGIAVVDALERVRAHVDLWIVPDLNPDGYARGTRQNRGPLTANRCVQVDLLAVGIADHEQ